MGKFKFTNSLPFGKKARKAATNATGDLSGSAVSKTAVNSRQPVSNYERYQLSPSEYLKLLLHAILAAALFSFVFYRSLFCFLFLLPLTLLFPFTRRNALIAARRRKLLLAFREALSLLAASLSAGYSLENALRESLGELNVL